MAAPLGGWQGSVLSPGLAQEAWGHAAAPGSGREHLSSLVSCCVSLALKAIKWFSYLLLLFIIVLLNTVLLTQKSGRQSPNLLGCWVQRWRCRAPLATRRPSTLPNHPFFVSDPDPKKAPSTAKVLDLLLLTAGKYKAVPGWRDGGWDLREADTKWGLFWLQNAQTEVIYTYLQCPPPTASTQPGTHSPPPGQMEPPGQAAKGRVRGRGDSPQLSASTEAVRVVQQDLPSTR